MLIFAGTMLNRAKDKIKRALSSCSKNSWSSSSSRDNMSVDSGCRTNVSQEKEEVPAIPRSRLCIKIMTMTEQIIFRNDYEWEALELLKGMCYAHAKRFETRFLMKMGLKKDMN